jgi:hypothetical protein
MDQLKKHVTTKDDILKINHGGNFLVQPVESKCFDEQNLRENNIIHKVNREE